jgi:hypothetical protein
LYVSVPDLLSSEPKDDLCTLLKSFQWVDWREMRSAEVSDGTYRRSVAELAERLAEMSTLDAPGESEEDSLAALIDSGSSANTAIGEPGFLDLLATTEEVMPQYNETVQQITEQMEVVGSIAESGTTEMTRAAAFSAKRIVAQRVAKRLEEPAARVSELTNDFSTQLHQIDDGMRLMIRRGIAMLADEPESKEPVCHFFATIRGLANQTTEALENVTSFQEAIQPIEQLSRDLRAPLRLLRESLTRMFEAKEVMREWVGLIETAENAGAQPDTNADDTRNPSNFSSWT